MLVSPTLIQMGVCFKITHVFSISGVCAPSRSALITGMYPISIGTHHMRTTHEAPGLPGPYLAVPPPHVKTFTEALRAAGYYCTNNAKTDYQFGTPLTAWDESSRTAHWQGRAPHQPFFAVFNSGRTHESRVWPNADEEAMLDPARVEVPPPLEELYDLGSDPHEIRNLAKDPRHEEILQRLRRALEAWRTQVGDMGLIPEHEMIAEMWPGGVQPTTAMPSIHPSGGEFDRPIQVTLSCPTNGVSIAYTTEEGKSPYWKLYTGPFELNNSLLRARAVRYGYQASAEAEFPSSQLNVEPGTRNAERSEAHSC